MAQQSLLSPKAISLYDELSAVVERHSTRGISMGEAMNAVELLGGVTVAQFQCALDRAADDMLPGDEPGEEWKHGR